MTRISIDYITSLESSNESASAHNSKKSSSPTKDISGFKEVKGKFNQLAVMEYFDRKVGSIRKKRKNKMEEIRDASVKAPSLRFLSPLTQGGSSFDKRLRNKKLARDGGDNSVESHQEQHMNSHMLLDDDANEKEKLLKSLNHNLRNLEEQVKSQ